MEEEHDELVHSGVTIAGRYKVVGKLGEGGMGSVLLVQHVHTEEKLALKVLHSAVIQDTSALERFRREAKTPARIDSDYVVRVTDADVADELQGAPFLVMEYLRGKDVEDTIEDEGPLSPTATVRILRQVARALDKAHRIGIIHRDLKPENIFLSQREEGNVDAKILDFGIAKFTSKSGEEMVKTAATSPGAIFGTPLYMSPEQAKGESDNISPQTDIWALGLIAHKMLTGKDLWTAETLVHLIAQIAYEPLPVPSEHGSLLGKQYDEWLLTCCARKAEDRFGSASEAVAALADALGMSANDITFDGLDEVSSVGPPSAVRATSGSVRATAFSKTDAQLATSNAGTKPERAGMLPVIAGGFLLLGVVGALLWLKPWHTDSVAVGAEVGNAAATAEATPQPSSEKTPAPMVEPGPAASGTESAPAPSGTATAQPTSEPTTTSPTPPTAFTPPPPAPPPSDPPPPKDPPPPVDPLSDRH